jgi:hypothetical protein
MATTGIGGGPCEGKVLAMKIESPGEQSEGDKDGRGWIGFSATRTGCNTNKAIHNHIVYVSIDRYCPSLLLLRYIHSLNK